jgi:hypothetical protein
LASFVQNLALTGNLGEPGERVQIFPAGVVREKLFEIGGVAGVD